MDEPLWHLLGVDEAAQRLDSDRLTGLTADEALRRRQLHGPNELREAKRRGPLRIFLDQFADFMILVLLAAALVAGLIGDWHDSLVIVVIVLLNALLGFVQEYRAERAMAALRRLAAPQARVQRAGGLLSVPASELVPGDRVLLEAGNVVPADLRLIEVNQLRTDEAALTGESQPVDKQAAALSEAELPLGDRHNMAYRGTQVVHGRAAGLVVATGMATELGRIAMLLQQQVALKTPLQQRLIRFGQRLALACILLCVLIFAMGVWRGEPPLLMFLTAVSLAVAAIPEALPAVITIALALGARSMVGQRVLIRRLPAVETLGSVSYICSDKTGTLTQNRMTLESLWLAGSWYGRDALTTAPAPLRDALLRAVALNNDARRDAAGGWVGDPTEVALHEAAETFGHGAAALTVSAPRIGEIPFDAERKRMTTLHQQGAALLACTKGAPESVLACCIGLQSEAGRVALDQQAVLAAAEAMAAQGLRVLAVACRDWDALPERLDSETVEQSLLLLGLVGLIDPPRPEAREAVQWCHRAGITPVMITGDHPATALAIARRLGIAGATDRAVTGPMLATLDPEQLGQLVTEVRVYARVAPEQKIDIVRALQARGVFVAMTGDGVNDAPALKRADIGVAMGQGGTEVACEAADMVLLDDNFASIVAAVREGRRIHDNIRRFVKYAVTTNSAEIWVLFLAQCFALPVPLLPIHILWINLLTDGLPGIALTREPAERDIMRRPPRPPNESLFAHGLWQHMLWAGLLMALLTLALQSWALHNDIAHWQSMVFTLLTLTQMAHVLAIRSERESLFTQGLASNLPLLGAVLLTLALQLAVLYLPPLQSIFRTAPLALDELLLCVGLAALLWVAVEIEKWLRRRGAMQRTATGG